MTRVLLTGGSGFIAAHVLESLLERGHSVITTVRTQEKADKMKEAHPDVPKDRLDFAIVPDIAQEGAFDNAVVSEPPFEAVIHTASPFHFNITDTKRDLLDPAINGTVGILKAIKKSAPTVKRVVITSSFAAIINADKGATWAEHTYTEADWNPITYEEATQSPSHGYRASKTLAERAAWDFVKNEKPNFTISTLNPPLVIGPVIHYLNDLNAVNTSNQRTRDLLQGKWKESIPDTGTYIWTSVEDLAFAHVRAIEVGEEAANQRFFITAGYFTNHEIADIVAEHFPQYADRLPTSDTPGGGYPGGKVQSLYKYDNGKSIKVLGLEYRSLEGEIVELVKSLQAIGI